jgi:hypothetical protein
MEMISTKRLLVTALTKEISMKKSQNITYQMPLCILKCCCSIRRYLHFAGTGDLYFNDLYNFNSIDMKWSHLNVSANLPSPRASMGFASALDGLFMFGGMNSSGGWFLASLIKFQTAFFMIGQS